MYVVWCMCVCLGAMGGGGGGWFQEGENKKSKGMKEEVTFAPF